MSHRPSAVPPHESEPQHLHLGPPASTWYTECSHPHPTTTPFDAHWLVKMIHLLELVAAGWLITAKPNSPALMLILWPTKLTDADALYAPSSLMKALKDRGCTILCLCAQASGAAVSHAILHTDPRTRNQYLVCHSYAQARGGPRCPFRINLTALFANLEVHRLPDRALIDAQGLSELVMTLNPVNPVSRRRTGPSRLFTKHGLTTAIGKAFNSAQGMTEEERAYIERFLADNEKCTACSLSFRPAELKKHLKEAHGDVSTSRA